MSMHDYTIHSKKNQNEENEFVVEVELEPIKTIEPAEPEAEVEVEEPQPAPVKTYDPGVVVGCAKLRVRSEPRFGTNVICEIDQGTRVMIDKSESTIDYYKIFTESGIEGFCVKTYIA